MGESLTGLPNAGEIPAAPYSPVPPQRQSLRGVGHDDLDRGQAFASVTSAIGQNGLAALAAIARQKAVLPLATDFRWLIRALHSR